MVDWIKKRILIIAFILIAVFSIKVALVIVGCGEVSPVQQFGQDLKKIDEKDLDRRKGGQ